jgi:cytoskeleton protein RodZ
VIVSDTPDTPDADAAPAPTAGMILAHTRESVGLSIEDVALQLKLAPRQVVAIERDDHASLPGRTFVRGFVRNYARLLRLDVDAVLAALPGDPPQDRPPFVPATRAIGEMPTERASRPNVARWAIPLVLIAIVAFAAYYEFVRPQASRAPSPPPVPAAKPAASAMPLDNPVRVATEPSTASTTSADTTTATTPAPAESAPAAALTPSAAAEAPTPAEPVPVTAAATPPRNQLELRFRGTSWVEVRDRSGNIVLSMTGSDGAAREIVVASPGEIIVGNVGAVVASWRGKPLDLVAPARQNVARIKLD